MDASRVSIVIPTMNEEASIGRVLDEVAEAMRGQGSYEVIVVDTASRDRTVEIGGGEGAWIVPECGGGCGRAYKPGSAAVRGESIVPLDADLAYPASRIPESGRYVEKGAADSVSGNRLANMAPGAMSGMHR